MDQEHEIQQLLLESQILHLLNGLYKLFQFSDDPKAEDHLGTIAEMKAYWEGDKGSTDAEDGGKDNEDW